MAAKSWWSVMHYYTHLDLEFRSIEDGRTLLPVLKHRDDMTEAEITERDRQRSILPAEFHLDVNLTHAAYRLAWEIEQGIDVFGLIENGFAIRASPS